jgi:NADH-quinone oxidoreductase subunit J
MFELFIFFLFSFFLFLTVVQESTFSMVFLLIIVFFLAALLLVIFSYEFLGYLLIIIYVGAVAVLFLFMVLLFDKSEYAVFKIKKISLIKKINIILKSFFLSITLTLVSLNTLFFLDYNFLNYTMFNLKTLNSSYYLTNCLVSLQKNCDVIEIASYLYSGCFIEFILIGFGLLVAMIGAILITRIVNLNKDLKKNKRVQDTVNQLTRQSARSR